MLGSRGQRSWVSSKYQPAMAFWEICSTWKAVHSKGYLLLGWVEEPLCPTASGKEVDLWQFQWCWRFFSILFIVLIALCLSSETCLKDMLWGLGEAHRACSSPQHLAESELVCLNLLALVGLYSAPWPRCERVAELRPLAHTGCGYTGLVHTLCWEENFLLCLSVL